MQLARLRFHIQSRTPRAESCARCWCALELERHYSKAQLLEAYLNLAPYGRNIEGVGAASEIYFGKEPRASHRHEAIALSVIPQSPSRRALRYTSANERARSGARQSLARLTESETQWTSISAAQAEPHATMLAPHFTTEILRESEGAEIQRTLDLDLQQLVERRIASYVAANARARHPQRRCHARRFPQHGSARAGRFGRISRTRRSMARSTARAARARPVRRFKPFVYALALDQGLIHPLTMLKDAPRSFGAFDPENFDREFVGPIKATDALARSRNIPAVTLASRAA